MEFGSSVREPVFEQTISGSGFIEYLKAATIGNVDDDGAS